MKQKLRVPSPVPWMAKRSRPVGCWAARALQAQRELRDHVLEPHVGAIDVVRAEDQHALEEFAAEIDRHDLADELAGAVGIARVERIGHGERGGLVGRDFRRGLINLRARGQQQGADAVAAAGVDHVDHPAHADVEHEFRRRVEEFGAVDEGEVVHLVHALRRGRDDFGVADIAGDEIDIRGDLLQAARVAARIVVKHPQPVSGKKERLDQTGADEAAAAGHEDAATAHPRRSSPAAAGATFIAAPCRCDRWAASINCCTR